MAIKSVKKSWGNTTNNINYVGKDFEDLRENLIEYAKTYYPETYSDFNESSPGMVFIEMASYIGDVLSFYQDTQLKESMLVHATERKNVVALAQAMGYRPKLVSPAVTTLTVYQLVPSIYNVNGNTGSDYEPDSRYYLKIKEGLQVTSKTNSNIVFRTVDEVDFENETDREIEVYQRESSTGTPELYLISKKIKAISATEVEITVSVPAQTVDYPTIDINDTDIIGITSVVEQSNNTKWYEVPYLAQESIFIEKPNTDYNSELSGYSSTVPYILEVQKTPHRFSVKINPNGNGITLQFGSGNSSGYDEIILPNPKNVGLGLANSINRLNSSIDPSNFLKTNTFGTSPAGKTFTIKYLKGGGVESNVNSGDLISISSIEYNEDLLSTVNTGLYNTMKNSVAVENLEPATGGRGSESIEEIRQNALAAFAAQNRAVTRQDYIVRAVSMPERYGSVAKVYVSADGEIDNNSPASILASPKNITEFISIVEGLKNDKPEDVRAKILRFLKQKKKSLEEVNNPFAINMYVLGYDGNKKLTTLNQAIKQNLKTYLAEYRILTDGVNIIDGFIVNIGVEFEISVYSNYNKTEVLANCISELQEYFDIDSWTFNKPINMSDVELILANVEGVLSVPSVRIINLCQGDGNYSNVRYNILKATKDKIVYPSLDPMVFEVKYPNKDIRGRVI